MEDAQLREVLPGLTAVQIKECSHASKKFKKLLGSRAGGDFLRHYVKESANCSELIQAWKVRREKPGMSCILKLVAAVLGHPEGLYKADDGARLAVSKNLDKFARLIIGEKLEDVYKELGCKEAKRQSAALLLIASIVRRGSGLAAEVAKIFDFKLPAFTQIAQNQQKKKQSEKGARHSTRIPFIGFAMSFLEVGEPTLLRNILHQSDMYKGVLRGLGNDDEETVCYVLSTLRDRVLIQDSLVPPALRSVLFGNVALEQLACICERESPAAETAYQFLLMVCTDPCNGLMPDLNRHPNPLKGNPGRLLGLMKKLKATHISYHRDLLLAIADGRPLFASDYMDEFPYNLEDHKSNNWFPAASLAANVISSARSSVRAVVQSRDPPSPDSPQVQHIMKCACLHHFSRQVITKGLLHADFLIKHGTLRLVLASLDLLDTFIGALKQISFHSNPKGWDSFKKQIESKVVMSLPDLQVLENLFSSLNNNLVDSESRSKKALIKQKECLLKRASGVDYSLKPCKKRKKLKTHSGNEKTDIVVAGLCSVPEASLPEDNEGIKTLPAIEASDVEKDCIGVLIDLWSLQGCSTAMTGASDLEIIFQSKLLDAVKVYHRFMPSPERSFDFFKVLPMNFIMLPNILQQSLLSLLIEQIGWCPKLQTSTRSTSLMYKHLRPLTELLLFSPMRDIRDQAYILAEAAMLSTGAFVKHSWEVCSWFLFLPGFSKDANSTQQHRLEAFHKQSSVVSFLCDAVSSVGNNLFKYCDRLTSYLIHLNGAQDVATHFSPLSICVLEKCLRLVSSDSGTFTEVEKFAISAYVCNTLSYLLQTQVLNGTFPFLIKLLLSEKFEDSCFDNEAIQDRSEWKPLQDLHLFLKNITQEQNYSIFPCGFEMVSSLFNGDGCKYDPSTRLTKCSSQNEISGNNYLTDTDSAVFSSLEEAPFYILFPVLFSLEFVNLSKHPGLVDLLLDKVPSLMHNHFVSSVSLVLYSINQMQSLYRIKPSVELEKHCEMAYVLVDKMLKKLLDADLAYACSMDTAVCLPIRHILDFSEIIFSHHALRIPLSNLLRLCEDLADTNIGENFENLGNLCGKSIHKLDNWALNFLRNVFGCFLSLCNGQILTKTDECTKEQILKSLKALAEEIISIVKNRFDMHMRNKDFMSLVGTLYILHILIDYISPFELLQLVDWMFSRVDLEHFEVASYRDNAFRVGLFIARCAFENISSYLNQRNTKMVPNACLWGLEETSSCIPLLERIYTKVCDISIHLNLELADICLLRAVSALCTHNYLQHHSLLLPLKMGVLRLLMSTSVEFVSSCIYNTSMTKAQVLVVLIEVSPYHMSVFGNLFTGVLQKSLLKETHDNSLLDDDYLMLLPVALSFSESQFLKFGERFFGWFRTISSYYSRILLDGFLNWKKFVSKDIFQIGVSKVLPSSTEEFHNVFTSSFLGKALQMWQHHLAFETDLVISEKRLELFDSICPQSSEHDILLASDPAEIGSHSFKRSLNFVNSIVAKISICRMLLFPEDYQLRPLPEETLAQKKAISSAFVSDRESMSRVRLLNILVHAWQLIVKKFPCASNDNQIDNGAKLLLFKVLEFHIITNITELTAKMCTTLVQSSSLPCLKELARSSLINRFEDPITLKRLRSILICFPGCKSSHVAILQLLLAHSQFAPTLRSTSSSSDICQIGLLFKPMSSILRSVVKDYTDASSSNGKDTSDRSELGLKRLEVVKLLRVLCCLDFTSGKEGGIDYKELVYLLLSSYGATLGETDLEIYNLMRDIELAIPCYSGIIVELDYLWGTAAVKLRNEQLQERTSTIDSHDAEAIKESRRRKFRENLSIDPKMCAATVLCFPYNRTTDNEHSCQNNFPLQSINGCEPHAAKAERIQQYDPVFILRLSIHSLSMDYLEPMEFASLGLLAVVFVSMSSPCLGIRKLGYEALYIFEKALKKWHKKKDLKLLRLLLAYLQNGIDEAWQQIPSIIAVFAAETSFILLDRSNRHYLTISKLLMRSPKVNLKYIPLLYDFIESSSRDFKSERLWILQLLLAGVNLGADAQICIGSSVFETLLNLYHSLIRDDASTELILLIVNKSVRLYEVANHLIKHCGLLSWLSVVLSGLVGEINSDQNNLMARKLTLLLEVVSTLAGSSDIIQWLKDCAYEQLSEFSRNLYSLIINGHKHLKCDVSLVNLCLQIIVWTLEISQERKIHEPHFTLSSQGLIQIYEAIKDVNNDETSGSVAELALRAILISTPSVDIFHWDEQRLSSFLMWLIATALLSDSRRTLPSFQISHDFAACSQERNTESFVLKLLYWLTAAVNSNHLGECRSSERAKHETMQSFLECFKKKRRGNQISWHRYNKPLAAAIFYLQQLNGNECGVLPSVVCGLTFLLLPDMFSVTGSGSLHDYGDSLSSLFSRIRSPAEAQPAWKWSFPQPANMASPPEWTDLEKLEELSACRVLLTIYSSFLEKVPLDKEVVEFKILENFGIFKWERSMMGN